MSNQELCTQYEFIVTMIESGNADKVVEILKNAIKRIDKGETVSSRNDEKS
ncbi:MAG: hypothetical protein J1E40_11850 [Oscillospiraceae bacterium]|nr:hypothetical protein [Oscillospiraceae bacterium]